jgi:uncharacterized phage protein (TIGR01671 family)
MGKVKRIRFDDDGNISNVLFKGNLFGVNVKINEIELMQATGLKDKNGKEIFEGDILHGNDGEDFWDVVKYDKNDAVWIRESVYCSSMLYLYENTETPSIVGNIYENPEVLR